MHLRWLIIVLLGTAPLLAAAQTDNGRDSLVQIQGIVLSADSLRALPAVSVSVFGTGRGTITGEHGLFTIVARLGNVIEISHIGYKTERFRVTPEFKDSKYNIVQYLEPDTVYMGNTVIRSFPTKAQFAMDFVRAPVDDRAQQVAKDNLNPQTLRILEASLPTEASDITRRVINDNVQDIRSAYQVRSTIPLLALLNPFVWKKFIQSMQSK
jgi:hypothetical protein